MKDRNASWLAGDKGILVIDESVSYSLPADEVALIVDYFIDRSEQSFESKRVFARKQVFIWK